MARYPLEWMHSDICMPAKKDEEMTDTHESKEVFGFKEYCLRVNECNASEENGKHHVKQKE